MGRRAGAQPGVKGLPRGALPGYPEGQHGRLEYRDHAVEVLLTSSSRWECSFSPTAAFDGGHALWHGESSPGPLATSRGGAPELGAETVSPLGWRRGRAGGRCLYRLPSCASAWIWNGLRISVRPPERDERTAQVTVTSSLLERGGLLR